MSEKYFTIIVKNHQDIESTDVSHLITTEINGNLNKAPSFKYGYAGSGPNELAANIMWASEVEENECLTKCSLFRDQVMHEFLTEDGRLYMSDIEGWLKESKIKRSPYYYHKRSSENA